MFENDGRCRTRGGSSKKGRGLFLKDGKGGKKISSLTLMTSGRRLRRSVSLSIDYQMAWWNMREWKKILRVLVLMWIKKAINQSKVCGGCRNWSNESS